MQLFFLHNIPIHIITSPTLLELGRSYDSVVIYQQGLFNSRDLMGNLLVYVSIEKWNQLLNEISQVPLHKLHKVINISILLPGRAEDIKFLLQQYFKPSKSAGGIVVQGENILMIYRSHMWDLPKGRIEIKEAPAIAAAREVQEECGVQALVKEEFFTTWHAFQFKHTHFLKKTTWYIMDCVNDSHLAPQKEEGIEQVAWIPLTKIPSMFENTFASIRLLLQAYQNYLVVQNKKVD